MESALESDECVVSGKEEVAFESVIGDREGSTEVLVCLARDIASH